MLVAPVSGKLFLLYVRSMEHSLGALLAQHNDEGHEQAYAGLHQWNLTDENGRFIVWNRSERVDVSDRLAGRGSLGRQ